ncbi:hypothetical protein [Nocardia huaxiensis]|uniref:hypothetical protein n=1 Tax=Nocardia huaxiensis TaxID=2755382 RepID=UPI001E4EE6DB|nr:hypothetical protein [Nocardia huaxiensis]UFS98470.1 hypothetical protein LPY97_11480 [Nocardia huaxiensis]
MPAKQTRSKMSVMNGKPEQHMKRLAEDLADLRREVGGPSWRRMQSIAAKHSSNPVSANTLRSAQLGEKRPQLPTVIQFVTTCRVVAESDGIAVEPSRFALPLWQEKWKLIAPLERGVDQTSKNGEDSDRVSSASTDRDDGWLWLPDPASSCYLLICAPRSVEEGLHSLDVADAHLLEEGLRRAAPHLPVRSVIEPTRSELMAAVPRTASEVTDVLIVHIMGSAYFDEDMRIYSMCSDSDPMSFPRTYAPLTELLGDLFATAQARAIVLVLDIAFASHALADALHSQPAVPHVVISAQHEARTHSESITAALALVLDEGVGFCPYPVLPTWDLFSCAASVSATMSIEHETPWVPASIYRSGNAGKIAWANNRNPGGSPSELLANAFDAVRDRLGRARRPHRAGASPG